MTFAVLGRDPESVAHSPKVRRVAGRLIQGCLTVPFDKEAVSCARSGRNLLSCAEELARRAPERRESLRALLFDLNQLGATRTPGSRFP